MGTVYEALKKSEQEQQQAALNGFRADGRGNGAAAVSEREDDFDFVEYSLNTPSAVELERAQQDMVGSSLTRQSQIQPARLPAQSSEC